MIHLTYIPPEELSETDLEELDSYIRKWSYDGTTVTDYAHKIANRTLALFRLSGEAEGIIGLEQVKTASSKELWLIMGTGKDCLRHAAEIKDRILQIARYLDFPRVFFVAGRPGMARVYQKVGLRFRASTFVQELG